VKQGVGRFRSWSDTVSSKSAVTCRGAAAAIIVYDITSTDSFNRAKAWVRELQRQGSPNMIMALAGGWTVPAAIALPAGPAERWSEREMRLLVKISISSIKLGAAIVCQPAATSLQARHAS
jgi:hypothetical protein